MKAMNAPGTFALCSKSRTTGTLLHFATILKAAIALAAGFGIEACAAAFPAVASACFTTKHKPSNVLGTRWSRVAFIVTRI